MLHLAHVGKQPDKTFSTVQWRERARVPEARAGEVHIRAASEARRQFERRETDSALWFCARVSLFLICGAQIGADHRCLSLRDARVLEASASVLVALKGMRSEHQCFTGASGRRGWERTVHPRDQCSTTKRMVRSSAAETPHYNNHNIIKPQFYSLRSEQV